MARPTLDEVREEALEKALVESILALLKFGLSETEVRRLTEHTLNEARRG